MTRARTPRPHEIDQARHDERLLRALREGGRDPAWRTRGACQDVDPETFFPAPSEPADNAMALCRTCPVLGACLAWALQAGDLHGVWGGTTARERRAMAVVWQGGQLGHNGQFENNGQLEHSRQLDPLPAPRTTASLPAPRTPAPAARAPAPLPDLGAVMDRAELLRLVKAG